MKQIFLAIAVCTATCGFAQNQSGIVQYQRILTFDNIELSNVPPEIAAMMPKEHKEEKILYYTADAALYENNATKQKDEQTSLESDNVRIMIRQDVPDEKYYVNLKEKTTVQQRSLMGRQFIIREEAKSYKWKMTGNQKKILDYAAMEAVAITDKDTVTAWYTTDIPVAAGPDGIGGLPGLILEAHTGSHMLIKATAVKKDDAVAARIKEPVKGKKISSAEYEKLEKEKEEEMKRQYGGSDNVIIHTVTN